MRRVSRETLWLAPVITPVVAGGTAALVTGVIAFAESRPGPAALAGIGALFVAAVFAEAFPVPIEGVPVGGTSLANIFIVAAGVLYGWGAGVLVGCLAMAVVDVGHRRAPVVHTVYNTALYGIAAAAAGAAAALLSGDGLRTLLAAAVLGSAAFYITNIGLLALVIARSGREQLPPLLSRYLRWTMVPFAIMASVTLMLVVMWERSPFLAAPLVGPMLAIALYQRSVHRALEAMRLARTDPLTGLANARYFNERLEAELESARVTNTRLAVCLLDVDGFKGINDLYGHAVGDAVLVRLAALLRQDGEAFRLGGDEFALLLPGSDEAEALSVGRTVVRRVTEAEYQVGTRVTVSAGVASFPRHARSERELLRLADKALYEAKDEGKNRVLTHRADEAELVELRRLSGGTDRAVRLRAAASLGQAVDERDAYAGRHSLAVGELSGRLASRLGLPPGDVELAQLAGRLHDLGKLAIPEEILRKPYPLSDDERRVLQRHAQIGFRMLDSLGVEPLASWVLHHHERWDGNGYPSGLSRYEIPLGARIIFVADAFDAMTSDRVYRRAISRDAAVAELARCAGTQFDPAVVDAFREEFAATRERAYQTA
jgi:diguanylate cyclase (GGDEF)-like protein/putative nucleotidyltransferase with HDIG domain